MTEKFITWLKAQVGSIYVWGGQGEIAFNEDWIRKMETSDKNANRAIALFRKRKSENKDPIAAYDCSGLIVCFLICNDIIQSDMTASGLYSICTPTKRENLKAGNLIFRHNGTKIHHVGVYIGNDMVIHAKGRDAGVVMEHIDVNGEDYWNRFAVLDGLVREPVICFPRIMRYGGATYVNLRQIASAANTSTVIDKITHDEEVLVLDITKNGWADVIKYNDTEGIYKRGFCVSKYLAA